MGSKGLTFKQARTRAQAESGVERMEKSDALAFCIDAVVDIVSDFISAGVRVTEEAVVVDGHYEPKEDLAFVLEVLSRDGAKLSPNIHYEALPDDTIKLPKGKYTITYTAFPNLSNLTEDSTIPLPKMFQEAIHWYLSAKFYGRLMGATETTTAYFQESYNQACISAERYYATRRAHRRMPAKMIG
jgi:hypothetical protein